MLVEKGCPWDNFQVVTLFEFNFAPGAHPWICEVPALSLANPETFKKSGILLILCIFLFQLFFLAPYLPFKQEVHMKLQ